MLGDVLLLLRWWCCCSDVVVMCTCDVVVVNIVYFGRPFDTLFVYFGQYFLFNLAFRVQTNILNNCVKPWTDP